MGKIVYSEEGGTGYGAGVSAVFSFISDGSSVGSSKTPSPKSTHTKPGDSKAPDAPGAEASEAKLDDVNITSTKWVDWGPGNDFPQKVISDVSKVSVAAPALEFKIKAHYGTGLITFKREVDEKGKVIIKVQDVNKIPEIKSFFKNSKIKRYFLEQITDLVWFYNVFPEMIVSRDFSKITSIRSLEAAFCRWSEMDEGERRIKILGYSALWPREEEITEIPVISPWWSVERTRDYLRKNKIWKFVYPTYIPTPGRSFYQVAYWNGARKSGWFDVAGAIPEFKKHLMKNQMTIKWHVEIPESYWDKLFPFPEFTKKKKKEKSEEKLGEMDDFLSDTKNTGKTFFSHFAVDPITKQPLPGWKITALDNKLIGGEYLEDSQAANSEIMFSMRVDPSLVGHGIPGGKLGAGSGSDKREAFNIYNSLLLTDRDVTVEPLEFIRDFNGWDEDLEFGFGNITLQTLDKNPTGTSNTAIA